MATINIQATGICSGGNHVTLTATVDGAPVSATYDIAVLRASLNGVDRDEILLALVKLRSIGKTAAEMKTDLQAGFTVTV